MIFKSTRNFHPALTKASTPFLRDPLTHNLVPSASTGGGGSLSVTSGTGPPTSTPTASVWFYFQTPGPNYGVWIGSPATGWVNILVQGP